MTGAPTRDFSTVTESTGNLVSQEAWNHMCSRYWFVGEMVAGRRVLEVGCGSGQGLGYLARRAKLVVGGDLTAGLLARAQRHYQGRIGLARLDAHALPFSDGAFDVVLLYEAIYYLRDPEAFLEEARRLLSPGGVLVIVSANPERPDFNPSPYSHAYYSADRVRATLSRHSFAPQIHGVFPVHANSVRDRLLMVARKVAVQFRLIPKTMDGKVWLKRLVYGKLVPIRAEVEDGPSPEVTSLATGAVSGFQVIYAVGRKL
ncbi:MAG: class I SAM-dependent methyltransferase [Gammaproteobacteria bacterium]|nr:class I SAM-dependent methyltransferase [Gammaproteobacteria bacterium]